MEYAKALTALFPGIRLGILSTLYREPVRWWRLGDLAGELRFGVAGLRRELSALVRGQILEQRGAGTMAEFRANFGSPFFGELRRILTKKEIHRQSSVVPAGHRETVLVVQDEPATLQISRILLESWGYRVLGAHDVREALGLFQLHRESIQLLLTDVGLPDGNGVELAQHLRQLDPSLRVLYVSGHAPSDSQHPETAFLAKPFNPEGLSRKVRETLDQPAVARQAKAEPRRPPGAEAARGDKG